MNPPSSRTQCASKINYRLQKVVGYSRGTPDIGWAASSASVPQQAVVTTTAGCRFWLAVVLPWLDGFISFFRCDLLAAGRICFCFLVPSCFPLFQLFVLLFLFSSCCIFRFFFMRFPFSLPQPGVVGFLLVFPWVSTSFH